MNFWATSGDVEQKIRNRQSISLYIYFISPWAAIVKKHKSRKIQTHKNTKTDTEIYVNLFITLRLYTAV